MKEENERLLHYLDYTTRKPLITGVEKLLIQDHVSLILSKGMFVYLFIYLFTVFNFVVCFDFSKTKVKIVVVQIFR